MNMAFRRITSLYRFPFNFCQYGTKIQAEIDPAIIKEVLKNSCARHPGQTHPRKVLQLPEDIVNAISIAIQDENRDDFIQRGYGFIRHLHSRLLPLEDHEKVLVAQQEESKTLTKLWEIKNKLHPDAYTKYEAKAHKATENRKKARENLWTPTIYDDQSCFQYLLLRGPANYAVLKAILSEIAERDPDFQPKSLLDFGSGVGTVSWVIEELWKSCQEFYNVDICSTMRDLATLILKRGKPQAQLSPGIFFRAYLPSSLKYTHDIVVSAYSLLELPSRKHRLETLLTLWNKTDGYLVVVEEGTRAGYKIILEARDFILEMAENEQRAHGGTGAHVFSPVHYAQHPSVQSSVVVKERYTYVVLKRGPRPPDTISWPRIVEEMKVRHKHIQCRLCAADGSLNRITLSQHKGANGTYKVLRNSVWGDSLPITLSEHEDAELSWNERRRLRILEARSRNAYDAEDGKSDVELENEEPEIREDTQDRDTVRWNKVKYTKKPIL